jgi:hypothetical protein
MKSVLPAIVPEMTYEGMEVADGQTAGLVWEKLLRRELGWDRKETMRKALLKYCEQDTLGLLEIVDTLRPGVRKQPSQM